MLLESKVMSESAALTEKRKVLSGGDSRKREIGLSVHVGEVCLGGPDSWFLRVMVQGSGRCEVEL